MQPPIIHYELADEAMTAGLVIALIIGGIALWLELRNPMK